jgi:hypothetical protein
MNSMHSSVHLSIHPSIYLSSHFSDVYQNVWPFAGVKDTKMNSTCDPFSQGFPHAIDNSDRREVAMLVKAPN